MSRFKSALLALITSICALAVLPVTPASAAGLAPSQPRIWHVLVGGHSNSQAIQAEGYYPKVITIDAGDTVVWTLNTEEIHSVTFMGSCGDLSCFPPCVFEVNIDISPCGSTSYDGVSGLASSGRMVPAAYNWNNAYTRRYDVFPDLHEFRRQRLFRPKHFWNARSGGRKSSWHPLPIHSGTVLGASPRPAPI